MNAFTTLWTNLTWKRQEMTFYVDKRLSEQKIKRYWLPWLYWENEYSPLKLLSFSTKMRFTLGEWCKMGAGGLNHI